MASVIKMTYLVDLTKLFTISSVYNNTSMTRTPMAHLPWLIQTLFLNPITKTRPFKYIENFTIKIKNSDIFHIPAPNIDCGYSLEPPRRGGSNECPQSMF